ncbi:MAG: SigE family RNA polymerase sigma factor [Nocardioidaceae bacterium]
MAIRRQEDISGFSELVAVRSRALYGAAYVLVGDHQLAQDLLQEALVKAYVAWPRLRDQSKAEAYVRRTIVTTAISWRRRRSFHERPVDRVPDISTADDTERLATADALWEHLRNLPTRQRAALFLRYHEDLSEAETAELMGCSVGAVKRQVFVALSKLRIEIDTHPGLQFLDDKEVTR